MIPGIMTFVMAERFTVLNVADRMGGGAGRHPQPNCHTPAEKIVVSHRRYQQTEKLRIYIARLQGAMSYIFLRFFCLFYNLRFILFWP